MSRNAREGLSRIRPWLEALPSAGTADRQLVSGAKAARLFAYLTTGLLALLLPTSVQWPIGRSFASGVHPMYASPGLFLTDLAVAGVLLAAALHRAPSARIARADRLSWLLLGIVSLGFATAPWAMSPVLALYTAGRWLIAFCLYLALVRLHQTHQLMLRLFLAGLTIQALVGLLQVVLQRPLGLPGELAIPIGKVGAATIELGDRGWLRAYGLTFNPNVLGGYLAAGLVLGLPLLSRRSAVPAWLLIGLGLLGSFSRSAWVATAVVLPVFAGWLAWRRPELRARLALVGGIGLTCLLAGGLLWGQQLGARLSVRRLASERASLEDRGKLIVTALESIAARPITGLGAGNFPLATFLTRATERAHAVHNVPLLLTAEVGIPGGILWMLLWFTPVLALERHLRRSDPWPVAAGGAWLILGIIGLWDFYPWGLQAGQLLTVSVLSWCSGAGEPRRRVGDDHIRSLAVQPAFRDGGVPDDVKGSDAKASAAVAAEAFKPPEGFEPST